MIQVRFLLTFLFLCTLEEIVDGKNYYFSSSIGNDSYTAAQAQNKSTPWRTLAKLNASFSIINPGDSILFKRGESFQGSIFVTKSGTSSSPITFSSYGSGALPVITLSTITGWSGPTGSIYKAAFKTSPKVSIFYQDGIPLIPMASSSLCTDGNWWCDGTMLYYKPTSGTISNHTVTVANTDSHYYSPGIDLSDCSYIVVDGLQFNSIGIGVRTFDTSAGTVGLTIKNSVFNYCERAIFMMPDNGNNTNTTVTNCTFYRNQCAISMYTTSALGTRPEQTWGTNTGCNISGNEMSQNGTIDGTKLWAYGTDFESIGLQNFMNGTICNNYIHDGYQIGIIIYNLDTRASDNNKITLNRIFNNQKGGLVLMGDNADQGASNNYSFNNNFISNNVFVNSAASGISPSAISFWQGKNTSKENYFVNNTLVGNLGYILFPTSREPYFTIENNIIYNPGKYLFVASYWVTKPASLVMDYNQYYQTTGSYVFIMTNGYASSYMNSQKLEVHSKFINPMFVNASANNYQLKNTSPAIDAGINVGLPFSGKAPDLGAYEYSAKPANPPKISGTPKVY